MSNFKNLVSAADLLSALFPNKPRRSLRWLNYRIADGTMPSSRVGSARVFDVEQCRAALERIQSPDSKTNSAVLAEKRRERRARNGMVRRIQLARKAAK